MNVRWPCLPLIVLLAAACSSSGVKGDELGAPPPDLGGFPPQTFEGIVHASASYGDDKRDLSLDLLEDEGIIPVKLKVRLRGEGQETAQIQAIVSSMNLRLFLPDGTSLASMSVDQVTSRVSSKEAEPIRRKAFRGDLLDLEAIEGYVFFELEPHKAFELDGRQIKHASGDIVRTMSVANSLLAFELEVDNVSQPFFVGLR